MAITPRTGPVQSLSVSACQPLYSPRHNTATARPVHILEDLLMANRAALLNTSLLSSDPDQLLHPSGQDGLQVLFVAESANRVPVPWLACFRSEDLRPVSVTLGLFGGGSQTLPLQLPCTSVATAQQRLQEALPLFTAVVGDASLAEGYWRRACEGLAKLPLPYLTLNPIEVLVMNDFEEEAEGLVHSLSGGPDALTWLRRLSFFETGFAPYSAEAYYGETPEELDHMARLGNSAALDAGYIPPMPIQPRPPGPPAGPTAPARAAKPWWKFW